MVAFQLWSTRRPNWPIWGLCDLHWETLFQAMFTINFYKGKNLGQIPSVCSVTEHCNSTTYNSVLQMLILSMWFIRQQLLAFGLSLLEGVDPNSENFVSAGIINTKNAQIGCLLRLEPNLQAMVSSSIINNNNDEHDEKHPQPKFGGNQFMGAWDMAAWIPITSPIEISVNFSVGLIRYTCSHISGPHEPIHVKLGVWLFFIINAKMEIWWCHSST